MPSSDTLTLQIRGNSKGAKEIKRSLDDVRKSSDNAGRSMDRTNAALGRNKSRSELAAKGLRALRVALAATAVGTVAAYRSFLNFNRAIAEVSTLLTDLTGFEELTRNVKDLAIEFGQDLENQARALYQTISAGSSDAADATKVLTVANELAVGGVTSVATAVDGLTSVLNAYNLGADSARDVSDAFFVAVRQGKTTVEELSSVIGRVAGLAASLGIGFDEVFAALSTVTTQGFATAEAVVALRQALEQILRPQDRAIRTAERLGISLNQVALQRKGLVGFFTDIQERTSGSTQELSKLFPAVQALQFALIASNTGAQKFAETMEFMRTRTGQTQEAVDKMRASAAFAASTFNTLLRVAFLEVGSLVSEIVTPVLERLGPVLNELIEDIRGFRDGFVAVGDGIRESSNAHELFLFVLEEFAGTLTVIIGLLTLRYAKGIIAATNAIRGFISGTSAQVASMRAVAVSSGATTAAIVAQTAAMRAASVAGAAWRGALALLGGPTGAVVIAASAVAYFISQMRSATEHSAELADTVKRAADRFVELADRSEILSEGALRSQIERGEERIRQFREELEVLEDLARRRAAAEEFAGGAEALDALNTLGGRLNPSSGFQDVVGDFGFDVFGEDAAELEANVNRLRGSVDLMTEALGSYKESLETVTSAQDQFGEGTNRVSEGVDPARLVEAEQFFEDLERQTLSYNAAIRLNKEAFDLGTISEGEYRAEALRLSEQLRENRIELSKGADTYAVAEDNLTTLVEEVTSFRKGTQEATRAQSLATVAQQTIVSAKESDTKATAQLRKEQDALNKVLDESTSRYRRAHDQAGLLADTFVQQREDIIKLRDAQRIQADEAVDGLESIEDALVSASAKGFDGFENSLKSVNSLLSRGLINSVTAQRLRDESVDLFTDLAGDSTEAYLEVQKGINDALADGLLDEGTAEAARRQAYEDFLGIGEEALLGLEEKLEQIEFDPYLNIVHKEQERRRIIDELFKVGEEGVAGFILAMEKAGIFVARELITDDEVARLRDRWVSSLVDIAQESHESFLNVFEGLVKGIEEGHLNPEIIGQVLAPAVAGFEELGEDARMAFLEQIRILMEALASGDQGRIQEALERMRTIITEGFEDIGMDASEALSDPIIEALGNIIDRIGEVLEDHDITIGGVDAGDVFEQIKDSFEQSIGEDGTFDTGTFLKDLLSSDVVKEVATGFGRDFATSVFGEVQGSGLGRDLGSVIGSEVGNVIGKRIGESLGGALGGAVGGPIGSFIGSFIGSGIGSIVDSIFGGSNRKRVAVGADVAAGDTAIDRDRFGGTEIGPFETDTGLTIIGYQERASGARDFANTLVEIDGLLQNLFESNVEGLDIFFDRFRLGTAQRRADRGDSRTLIGFSERERNAEADQDEVRQELADAIADFTETWLRELFSDEEMASLIPELVREVGQALNLELENLLTGIAEAFRTQQLLDLDIEEIAESILLGPGTSLDQFESISAEVEDLATRFDGSAESLSNLNAVLEEQKNLAVQLLVAYAQLEDELERSTSALRDTIQARIDEHGFVVRGLDIRNDEARLLSEQARLQEDLVSAREREAGLLERESGLLAQIAVNRKRLVDAEAGLSEVRGASDPFSGSGSSDSQFGRFEQVTRQAIDLARGFRDVDTDMAGLTNSLRAQRDAARSLAQAYDGLSESLEISINRQIAQLQGETVDQRGTEFGFTQIGSAIAELSAGTLSPERISALVQDIQSLASQISGQDGFEDTARLVDELNRANVAQREAVRRSEEEARRLQSELTSALGGVERALLEDIDALNASNSSLEAELFQVQTSLEETRMTIATMEVALSEVNTGLADVAAAARALQEEMARARGEQEVPTIDDVDAFVADNLARIGDLRSQLSNVEAILSPEEIAAMVQEIQALTVLSTEAIDALRFSETVTRDEIERLLELEQSLLDQISFVYDEQRDAIERSRQNLLEREATVDQQVQNNLVASAQNIDASQRLQDSSDAMAQAARDFSGGVGRFLTGIGDFGTFVDRMGDAVDNLENATEDEDSQVTE